MTTTTRTYDELFADAVKVLTEAARLTRPVLERDEEESAAAGHPVWRETGRREPADWAEFVTLALAGAAANIGGVEAVLAGRPGSWEADGVRQLLASTVGHDQEYLLEHRTEPVAVDLYVDEILVDLGAWKLYDDAVQELDRRYRAIGIPSATGVPTQPTDADKCGCGHERISHGTADTHCTMCNVGGRFGCPAFQSAALTQLPPATEEQDRQADAIAELEERLEAQRLADWAAYGQTLKAAVEAAAGRREGLQVPVVVNVDLETFRRDRGPDSYHWGIADQLVEEAVSAVPLPGDGRSPLARLEDATAGAVTPSVTPSAPVVDGR